MILIDTSVWIEFIRTGGKSDVGQRVRDMLLNRQAAWCDMVKLELWNGAGGEPDRKMLSGLSENVVNLETSDVVWARSLDLTRRARAKGMTIPAADLLIAACAFHHGVEIETSDKHFQLLAKFR